jgi:hypothetical protein
MFATPPATTGLLPRLTPGERATVIAPLPASSSRDYPNRHRNLPAMDARQFPVCPRLVWLPPIVLVFGATGVAGAPPAPESLPGLRTEHPRLIATADDWQRLAVEVSQHPELARLDQMVRQRAAELLNTAPLERELVGRRMLGVARDLLLRTTVFAYAWRRTGDPAYVARAEREMLAAAGFTDWNPSHFLDTAETTAALALGYDWCHDALSPPARAAIRHAIAQLGLRPALDPSLPHNRWHRARNNWSQVCWGGLALGALAIADHEPDLAATILRLARDGIAYGLEPYAPDGIYPEGPMYWSYGTSFQVLLIAGLRTALGEDWNLMEAPGLRASAGVQLQLTAPSGRFFNFADGSEGRGYEPISFWFARELGDPGLAFFSRRTLAATRPGQPLGGRFTAFVPLWWSPSGSEAVLAEPQMPTVWHGDGPNPVAVFRECWTDPHATYFAIKGGSAAVNHAHMDAGSFIYEADGVRWAIDLGAQDYESLEHLGLRIWNRSQSSDRWRVLRLGPHSHNTLTIDGQLHRVDGHARFVRWMPTDPEPHAIIDLSPVFAGQAAQVLRGVRRLSDRRMLLQDELTGLTPGAQVRWRFTTRAAITLGPSPTVARLVQDDRTLHLAVDATPAAEWTVAPVDALAAEFDTPNPGVSQIVGTATAGTDGRARFVVVLAPGAASPSLPSTTALADW